MIQGGLGEEDLLAVPINTALEPEWKKVRDVFIDKNEELTKLTAERQVRMPTPGASIEARLGACDACEEFIMENRSIELDELKIEGIKVLRGVEDQAAFEAGLNNEVNANGLLKLLRLVEEGKAYGEDASARMRGILLGQRFKSGIPAGLPETARVAHKSGNISTVHHDAGIVYLDGAFYYHAWSEVWLGQWVAVDPTFHQFPADATHVKFVEGGPEQHVALLKVIGQISLEILDYKD